MYGNLRRIVLIAIAGLGLLLPTATNAAADNSGCSFATCVYSESYAGGYYVAHGFFVPASTAYGHWHLWGPNLDRNSHTAWFDHNNPGPRMGGQGVGTVCSQFWIHNPDGSLSPGWGLPCVPTH